MPISIKVSLVDFEEAKTKGYVDGLYKGKKGMHTYVELGYELEYIPKHTDDRSTQFKRFRNCNLYFASKKEDIQNGSYEAELLNQPEVIIYC